jgi:GNAT superfamily N-acetyltransferase
MQGIPNSIRIAPMTWRAMQRDDLAAVNRIAAQVHPDYPESAAVFAERLALFAEGCWIACDAQGVAHAYAITHPAVVGQPPALNCLLQCLPVAASCLYLHDIAVTENARGASLGFALLNLMEAQARALNIAQLALVAVNGSGGYWQRHGFVEYAAADAVLAAKLISYDATASYLVRPLATRAA